MHYILIQVLVNLDYWRIWDEAREEKKFLVVYYAFKKKTEEFKCSVDKGPDTGDEFGWYSALCWAEVLEVIRHSCQGFTNGRHLQRFTDFSHNTEYLELYIKIFLCCLLLLLLLAHLMSKRLKNLFSWLKAVHPIWYPSVFAAVWPALECLRSNVWAIWLSNAHPLCGLWIRPQYEHQRTNSVNPCLNFLFASWDKTTAWECCK